MQYVYLVMYFCLFSSTVYVYGIGLQRSLSVLCDFPVFCARDLKQLCVAFVSAPLSYLIMVFFLLPLGIGELYVFIAALLVTLLSLAADYIVPSPKKICAEELIFPFLCVMLTVSESQSLLETVLLTFICCVSLCLVLLLVQSFNRRMKSVVFHAEYKVRILLYMSIAILVLAFFGWNFSWLSMELFKR